jgi:hypothetical protein
VATTKHNGNWKENKMSDLPEIDNEGNERVSRRKVLAKLGLAAGVTYMAPVMLSLSQAHASGGSGPSRSGGSHSGPSRSSSSRSSSSWSLPSRSGSRRAGPPRGWTWQRWMNWLNGR